VASLRRLLFPILIGALFALLPAAARAQTGTCGTASCHFLTGKVTFLDDGDTIDVNIDGDGTRKAKRIRITGIQAMEMSRYSKYRRRRRGACHAVRAANDLENLLRRGHGRVRLAAVNDSSYSRHRPRRHVDVRIRGRWVDVGAEMLKASDVLWDPNLVEYAWNDQYHALEAAAAAGGQKLWNPNSCGKPQPAAGVPIGFEINWDAPHNDFDNVNGEWAKITNNSPSANLPIGHWWFRDAALRRYTFPSGAVIGPGQTATLFMGKGQNGGGNFYWGLSAPVFENVTGPPKNMGDGGYLFDSRGNLRAFSIY
jgi:micrococcal nuclease